MKTALFLCRTILSTLPLALLTSAQADVLIDSFSTPQTAPGGSFTASVADGSGILGGERDIYNFLRLLANGTVPGQLQIAFPDGLLTGLVGGDIIYDGVDHDPFSSSMGGLGSGDLTQGGVNDRFRFDITSIANTSATLLIDVWSPFHESSLQVNLPQSPGVFDLPFAWFRQGGTFPASFPVDFHNVGYIEFEFVIDSVITTVPEPSTLALMSCLSVGLLAMRRKPIGKSP
jgi:hypothetical protein